MLMHVIVLHFAADPEYIPPEFVERFQDKVSLSNQNELVTYVLEFTLMNYFCCVLLIVNKPHNL